MRQEFSVRLLANLTVVVMACDDEIIPLQERIETAGNDADLQEVYDTASTSPAHGHGIRCW